MNEPTEDQKPESESNQNDEPKQPPKAPSRKAISRVSLAVAGLCAASLLANWAGLIGNLGHSFWLYADVVMVFASIFAAITLRWELRNHHWKKQHYNSIAILIVVVALALGVPPAIIEFRGDPKIESPPEISPNRIQLGDGKLSNEQFVDVFNPNDFPIYPTIIRT